MSLWVRCDVVGTVEPYAGSDYSFYVPTTPQPSPLSQHFTDQNMRERSNTDPMFSLPTPGSQQLVKATTYEAFNLRGMRIFPVYPPLPTTLLPPSLRETARRGKVGHLPSGESKPVTVSAFPPSNIWAVR